MLKKINVHFLPALVTPADMAGHAVVMIDVLRASTTISHALAAGAREVVPCLEVNEARDLARRRADGGGQVLLGGERGGRRIEGFDLGNSPREYTSSRVHDRSIFFTTTNGTRALMAAIGASRVVLGAFVNLSALCHLLASEPRVEILCAGTDGQITREDVLLAGAIVERFAQQPQPPAVNDQAQLARDAWQATCGLQPTAQRLTEQLRQTQGGRNLVAIGHEADLAVAAQIDALTVVPELDRSGWTIGPARPPA